MADEGVATDADRRSAGVLAAIGEVPLRAPPRIGVHGPSWLAPNGEDTVRLEEVAQLVGGSGAWWWGTWVTGGRLWRAVVRPDGTVFADSVDFGPYSDARLAVARHESGLLSDIADRVRRLDGVRQGALAERPVAERRLALRLGKALLPAPLRVEIARRAVRADAEPLSLVIAPAAPLARLSFDLLAVAWGVADVDTPTGPDPRRLMEGAIVRLGPSAAFVDALAQLRVWGAWNPPSGGAPPYYVVDPTGELANSRITNRFFTGLEGRQATTDAVMAGLATHPREGVWYYTGHGIPAKTGNASSAALQLHDGELTARMLIQPDPGKQFRIPRRVFVRGCSTSGADGAGRGEWLTLAPSLLWAGARTVIATAWDLIDHPDSSAADLALLDRICAPTDPAEEVRAFHLDRLTAWRNTGRLFDLNAPAGDGKGNLPAGYPAPVLWAYHVVVGLFGG